jgi:hypothetical protein
MAKKLAVTSQSLAVGPSHRLRSNYEKHLLVADLNQVTNILINAVMLTTKCGMWCDLHSFMEFTVTIK